MSAEVLEAVEAIEEVVDTVIRVNVIKTFFSRKHTQIGLTAVVAVGLGLVTGYKIAEKKLQAKYDVMLEEELERSREFLYEQGARINREGDFADPEKLLASIDPEHNKVAVVEAGLEKASTMTVDYSKMFTGDSAPDDGEENEFLKGQPAPEVEISEEVTVVQRHLFADTSPEDMDAIDAANQRNIAEAVPYVISKDDFNENETEWEQVTITWFAGDSVLVDETEQMIDDVEGIVKAENMDRFGYLSGDNNIVYIRNPEKELEFEVVRSEGSYAQEVLGFTHSDETFERRQRRTRRGDDG